MDIKNLQSLAKKVMDKSCDCKPYDEMHGCDWFSNYRKLEQSMAKNAAAIFTEIETLRANLKKAKSLIRIVTKRENHVGMGFYRCQCELCGFIKENGEG